MGNKEKRSKSGTIVLILICFFQFHHISAQVEIPDSLIMERIRVIEKMLIRGKPNADRWWYGWLAGYSAATIGQGVVYLSGDDKALRQDMALGAATTLLGAAAQLLTPMLPSPNDLINENTKDTHKARLQKLSNAEELLKASSLIEKSGKSWQIHAVTGVVNVSSGLITWLGFKRDVWAGVGNFALNTIITEAQIWTQPTRAMKDYKAYCKKYGPGENPGSEKSGMISWFVSAGPGGINIKIVF
jgi:hypothetical protein